MKKPILSIAFALCTVAMVFGQYNAGAYLKAANKAIEKGNFFSSMVNYGKAIELGESSPELKYNYALSALNVGSYGIAESALEDYVNNEEGTDQAAALLKLGQIKQELGKYDDAERYYSLYMTEYGDLDAGAKAAARMGKKASLWASKQPTEWSGVEIEHLGREVNSNWADVSPYLLDGELYFSSLRFGSKMPKNPEDLIPNYAQILTKGGGPLASGANFNIKEADKLTGAPSFNKDGSIMFYNLCEFTGDVIQPCEIYMSTKGGGYSDGTKLSEVINVPGFSSSHPSLVDNGGGSYTLYFASNRPGGSGGMDIWVTEMNSEMDFSAPTNVGGVNTGGDDFTPFYHAGTQTLYWSSNGQGESFGGYDLYMANGDGSSFSGAANMGLPYNSANHDRYYWLNEAGDEAYLVSNRPGSFYSDDQYETCCHDIYKLNIDLECEMMVNVKDCNSGAALGGANICITNKATGEEVYCGPVDGAGSYKASILRNTEYVVTAENDCYGGAKEMAGPFSGDDCSESVDLCLEGNKVDMTICNFDQSTSRSLLNSEACLVDGKSGKQDCKKVGKDGCATFSTIVGKSYNLRGKKSGYIDGNGSIVANCSDNKKNLYLGKPAPKQVSCIETAFPVRLYFDNDEPNPRTKNTTSTESYSTAYSKYYSKKEEYKRRYSADFGFKSGDRVVADADMNSFFENELRGGNDRLNMLMDCLLQTLQSGQNVSLAIKGFTSPLANSGYNEALSKRRIDSVRKSIQQYQGGALMQYINSGQLKLSESSLGETSSPSEVSDSGSRRNKSVYSPDAARERRVEIQRININ